MRPKDQKRTPEESSEPIDSPCGNGTNEYEILKQSYQELSEHTKYALAKLQAVYDSRTWKVARIIRLIFNFLTLKWLRQSEDEGSWPFGDLGKESKTSSSQAATMVTARLQPKVNRVLFVLPVKEGGGGVHSIVQECIGMRLMATEACVAVPYDALNNYYKRYKNVDRSIFIGFKDTGDLIEKAACFDVAIATIFTSVKLIKRMVSVYPQILPAYYIQDYEPMIVKDNESLHKEALSSYTLIPDLVCFSKTDWLCRTVSKKHSIKVHKVVPSLDTSVYYPIYTDERNGNDSSLIKIAAMVRPKTPRRNPELTMDTLLKLKNEYGQAIEINIFGCKPSDPLYLMLKRDFEFSNHGVLVREEVAALLRASDIFIDLSKYQAFGRTALEAMACRCAVVVPEAGGADEYAKDGINALVVDTSDQDAILKATEQLIEDSDLRERLTATATDTVLHYSINRAAASILSVLSSAANS